MASATTTRLLLALSAALLLGLASAEQCAIPDYRLRTCVLENGFRYAHIDCPKRSKEINGGGAGKYYSFVDQCCKAEFGGFCKEYTTCVFPDKNLGGCVKETVAFAPRDCPPKSASAGGKGSYYGTISDCCAREFGGKCKDFSRCVYPDKNKGLCVDVKVDFAPRDCPSKSSAAGGKGAYYTDMITCCSREFGGPNSKCNKVMVPTTGH